MNYEELAEIIRPALTPVRAALLLKQYGKDDVFQQICTYYAVNPDEDLSAYYDALAYISDYFEASDADESSDDVASMYFSDRDMMEYYRLCREFARLNHLPFEECCPVLKAKSHVQEWMGADGCYYCGYTLQTDTTTEWGCGILFQYCVYEFWEFFPLLQRTLEALAFYKRELPALRHEVDDLKRNYALAIIPNNTPKENCYE